MFRVDRMPRTMGIIKRFDWNGAFIELRKIIEYKKIYYQTVIVKDKDYIPDEVSKREKLSDGLNDWFLACERAQGIPIRTEQMSLLQTPKPEPGRQKS